MTVRASPTSEFDQAALRAAIVFLDGRLAERGTIEWALDLKEEDAMKRRAIFHLLDGPEGRKLAEPWRSSWRLIEESWSTPPAQPDVGGVLPYRLQQRLRDGDRSGALIGALAAIVAPRLKVKRFSDAHMRLTPPPHRARRVIDLFSIGISSGRLLDLDVVKIAEVKEAPFLSSLALALEGSIATGLDIASRLGWDARSSLRLGQLNRVYYVPAAERAPGTDDPDEYVKGIAPSVKLLHAVVTRLSELDLDAALEFVRRWKVTASPVHQRLWAAMARDARFATAEQVAAFFGSLDARAFWDAFRFPEATELRARRFVDLSAHAQNSILIRIRRRPPRSQWGRDTPPENCERYRTKWAAREFRRLEIAGVTLPEREKAWLDGHIANFPDLAGMAQLNEGFPEGIVSRRLGTTPDAGYDSLQGAPRLMALETAFSAPRNAWDDSPAEGAQAWIRLPGNALQVLADFDVVGEGSAAFPKIWERFGWTHSPEQRQELAEGDLRAEAIRVVTHLARLPVQVLQQSVGGIAQWYSTWRRPLAVIPGSVPVWQTLWGIAAETTNAAVAVSDSADLSAVAPRADDAKSLDVDTLNTPVGKLVELFLAMCPNLADHPHPFANEGPLRTMRTTIIATQGRSGLIARHRLIESIPYFLNADPEWTQEHLVEPLRGETAEALSLWHAISRRFVFGDSLRPIGDTMSERAADARLDRETRQRLVFNLVLDSLFGYKEQRASAVAPARIQQMLRTVEDEVRAQGAEAVTRFVVDNAAESPEPATSAADLFRQAVAPFLARVWPLERSLVRPGVTRAFAPLPAATGEAFVEAVAAIERFLVPFDCWSMFEFGFLEGDEGNGPKLSSIDSPEKAAALLRLLDRSIGTSEGAVIPHGLSDALSQIRTISPALADTRTYSRLATAARSA
jgi:hypothetical protein